MVKAQVEHEDSIMSKLLKIEDNSVMSAHDHPEPRSLHPYNGPDGAIQVISFIIVVHAYQTLGSIFDLGAILFCGFRIFYDIPHINPFGFLVVSVLNLDVVSSDNHDWRDCLNSPAFQRVPVRSR